MAGLPSPLGSFLQGRAPSLQQPSTSTAMAPFPSDAPLQLVPLLPSVFLCVRRASMAGAPSSSPSLLLAGEQRSNSPMDGAQKTPAGSPLPPPLFLPQASSHSLCCPGRGELLSPLPATRHGRICPLHGRPLLFPAPSSLYPARPIFFHGKKNQQRAPSSLSSVVPVGCSTKCAASRAVQQPIRDAVKTRGEKPPLFSMFIFRCV